MSDIYSTLVGDAPTSQEQLTGLADALRKRERMGQILQLSGDKVMAPMGQGMVTGAADQAKQIGLQRSKQQQREMTENYYNQLGEQAQLKHSLDQQKFAWEQSQADLDREHALALQELKNEGSSSSAPRMRATDIKALRELSSSVQGVSSNRKWLEDNPDFNPGQMSIDGTPIPFGRTGANWLASKGYGPEDAIKAQQFWQNYKRDYELVARHAMFGSALTQTEKEQWAQSVPNPEMTREQIITGLKLMEKVYGTDLNNYTEGLRYEGYNPAAIDRFGAVEPGLNIPDYAQPGAAPTAPTPAAPAPTEDRAGKVFDATTGKWE